MKTAVVIGAGKIGSAIAGHLLRHFDRVEIAGHSQLELGYIGAIERYFARFARIDCLVNAAGTYGAIGKVGEVDPHLWAEAFLVNTRGVYACCHYALPRLAAGGHIVNLAGGGAVTPVSHLSGYGASKAALVRLTETLALEYPGLCVNAISPGPMVSRMQEQLLAAGPETPHYGPIKAMCDSGIDEVPIEKTLQVLDHILAERPTGKLFFARTFKPAVAEAA